MIKHILILIFCFGFLISCDGQKNAEYVLFDFESDQELDQLKWKCHVLYSLSNDHVEHGTKSLKMEMFPSPYPGFSPELGEKGCSWAGYDYFCFTVFNPSDKTIDLALRIDDRKQALNYNERYNKRFQIVPGKNKIIVALNKLKTSETQQPMNLRHIYKVLLFMAYPDKPHELYLDHFYLRKGGGIERKK